MVGSAPEDEEREVEPTLFDAISEQRVGVNKLPPGRQGFAWAEWFLSFPELGDKADRDSAKRMRDVSQRNYQALRDAVAAVASHPVAARSFVEHVKANDDRFWLRATDNHCMEAVRSRIEALFRYRPLLMIRADRPHSSAVLSLINWVVDRMANEDKGVELIRSGLINVAVGDLDEARDFVSRIKNKGVRTRARFGIDDRRRQHIERSTGSSRTTRDWAAKIQASAGLEPPVSVRLFPAGSKTDAGPSPHYWSSPETELPVVVDLSRHPKGFPIELGPGLDEFREIHRVAFSGDPSFTGLAEFVRAIPGNHDVIISGEHPRTMAQFARFLKRPNVAFTLAEVPPHLVNTVPSVPRYRALPPDIDLVAELAEHDPFVVWGAQEMRDGAQAWATDGAVAVLSHVLWKNRLFVRGKAEAAATLVRHIVAVGGARVDRVWAEIGLTKYLIKEIPWLGKHDTDWVMHTREVNLDPPPIPRGAEVKWCSGADLLNATQRRALLSRVLRYSYSRTPAPVDTWVQAHTPEGNLASIAASAWAVRGVGFISAVGTDPKLRRDQHKDEPRSNYGGRVFHEILGRLLTEKGEAMLLVGTKEESAAARSLYRKYGMKPRLMMSATVGKALKY